MKHMPGSSFSKKPVITSMPIHPPEVAPVLLGRPPLAMMGQSIESFIGLQPEPVPVRDHQIGARPRTCLQITVSTHTDN